MVSLWAVFPFSAQHNRGARRWVGGLTAALDDSAAPPALGGSFLRRDTLVGSESICFFNEALVDEPFGASDAICFRG